MPKGWGTGIGLLFDIGVSERSVIKLMFPRSRFQIKPVHIMFEVLLCWLASVCLEIKGMKEISTSKVQVETLPDVLERCQTCLHCHWISDQLVSWQIFKQLCHFNYVRCHIPDMTIQLWSLFVTSMRHNSAPSSFEHHAKFPTHKAKAWSKRHAMFPWHP